jgi:hypothetical protein
MVRYLLVVLAVQFFAFPFITVWFFLLLQLSVHTVLHRSHSLIPTIKAMPQQLQQQHLSHYLTRPFLCYIIYNFLGEYGVVSKYDDRNVEEFLQFSHHQVVLSVPPKTSIYAILVGTTTNRTAIDMLSWIASGKLVAITLKISNLDQYDACTSIITMGTSIQWTGT